MTQLLEFRLGLFLGFLGQLGLGDAIFDFGHLVAAVLTIAKFLLNGLHLLIQIVLALGLLHLALDARTDALLDLENRNLAFHEAERLFKARLHAHRLQHFLLFGDLDGEMRGNRIRKLGIILDLAGGADNLGRDLLVQLDVVLELRDDRAAERLNLNSVFLGLREHMGDRFVEIFAAGIFVDVRACASLDQHLDGAIRQLQQLQDIGDGPGLVNSRGGGSSSPAFIWVASMICLSEPMTSSRARMDFSRPTKSGTIM